MFEDTNQTQQTTQNDAELDLFDADDAGLLDDSSAPEDTQPQVYEKPAGQQDTNAGPEALTVKNLGKETPVDKQSVAAIAKALGTTEEAVIANLQKGMNYDHIAQERDRLRNAEEIKIIDEYAKISGLTRDQYIAFLRENQRKAAVDAQAQRAAQQYPDAPPEMLSELAQLRLQQQREQQAQQAQQAARQPWNEFFGAVKLTPAEIPQEVMTLVGRGMRPLEAYYKHQNEQLQLQLAARQTNEKNKQAAIGSAKGDAADTGKDPFLAGFYG